MLLIGWKDITEYLSKYVKGGIKYKTAKRWIMKYQLPIYYQDRKPHILEQRLESWVKSNLLK